MADQAWAIDDKEESSMVNYVHIHIYSWMLVLTIYPTVSLVAHTRIPILVFHDVIGQNGNSCQDHRHAPSIGIVGQKPMLK